MRPDMPKTLQYLIERKPARVETQVHQGPLLQDGRHHLSQLTSLQSAWLPFTPEHHAAFLRNRVPSNSVFFIDTCFLTGWHLSDNYWEALLDKIIVIDPGVWKELQPWLRKEVSPNRNGYMRDAIYSGHKSIKVLDHDGPPSFRFSWAYWYYVWLLSSRKMKAWDILQECERALGRQLSYDEIRRDGEFRRKAQQIMGMPGYCMALKVLKDRYNPNMFNDEHLVINAVLTGLAKGVETHILTRDEDVFGQFHKMSHLLNLHYLSMKFADYYSDMNCALKKKFLPLSTPELKLFFYGCGNFLVEKPDDYRDRILSKKCDLRPLHCLLFAGEGMDAKYSKIAYAAVKEMMELLIVKEVTQGLNSRRLGSMNCHVSGFPVGVENPLQWVVICDDRRDYNGTFSCPRLDYAHSIDINYRYDLVR